jgi:uncharacterized membrane protein YedE/YeeE
MTILILILGFLFGLALQYARLNKYNTISGLAVLDNLTVAKAIAVTIGIGAILLNIEIGLGFASFHAKPLILGGIIIGGLLFGIGMAILGYCPGTMPVSMGEGSVDALIGIIGGLTGGLFYTIVLPVIQGILGPDLGIITLKTITGSQDLIFFILLFAIGGVFTGVAFWLNKLERSTDIKWFYAGIGLAVLNCIVFLSSTTNRVIGASSAYPYLADLFSGNTNNDYYTKIIAPGKWEVIFLSGAFLSGLIISLIKKEFRFVLIHENWKKYKNSSSTSRIIWAFLGGFILIFGARMAGGCTSGHIISGGMQLAVSSLLFAIFVFTGLLITGKLFYNKT